MRSVPPPRPVARRRRVFLVAVLVLLAALVWFLWSLFQPFHGDGTGRVAVTIPRKTGVGGIASLLEKRGVISSSFFFEARATLAGKRGNLKPGSYVLKRDMSYSAALNALTKGPPNNVVTVVVPEGRSRREIGRSLKGLRGNYLVATKRRPPSGYKADHAITLEGFLFPATYQLKPGTDVSVLVAKQLQAFRQRFATVSLVAARRKNLTPFDVLTIASLVERETAVPSERRLIASVIYNRLHAGTPLGIDATTRFEFDKWSGALTRSELASSSPYNTRTHAGLPPGPIGNPGLASIRAAAAPAHTSFMFYVANPCRPGTHTFTRTLSQFNAAVARYDAARRKAGGNAPQGC
jgi:peptidoglycan lytic transglycosylase G